MEAAMAKMVQDGDLWVFGYGSLLWKPGFRFVDRVVGHIKGCKRRFFQGNTNLRGSPDQPGRVAILVPDDEEVTWGVAYKIRGQENVQQALEHLYVRENSKGGYHTMSTTFHPRHDVNEDNDDDVDDDLDEDDPKTPRPFTVMCFTATSNSPHYMGDAEMGTMAKQVVSAKGQAGPNSEYVLRTAEYVREHIPEDRDQHLFGLEQNVRELLAARYHRRNSLRRDSAVALTVLPLVVPV